MSNIQSHSYTDIPKLVAHRGYASRYPENTLAACEAALQAGACFIEIDIQLTADGVPVLHHDQNLYRTTGTEALISEISSRTLRTLDAGERQRLGDAGPVTPVPTLSEFVELLQSWPHVHAFIEIKEESLTTFGHEFVIQQILEVLAPVQPRCIPISYDAEVLRQIRAHGTWKIGWVIRTYDEDHRQQAQSLAPEFLICNYNKTGHEQLWPGPWQWVLYEITDAQLALQLHQRGAQLIETMAIGDLLQDTDLGNTGYRPQESD